VKKADRPQGSGRRPRAADAPTDGDAGRGLALQGAMPESDPAYPILSAVLDIIPASRWTFARIDPKGALDSLYGSQGRFRGLAGLADEFKRQRTRSASGPRIAVTLGSLEEFASGITLVFADARANFGILTLLRTPELGPFTSSEISMLTFALDAISDRLSALRMQSPEGPVAVQPLRAKGDVAAKTSEGAFYVLDSDLQIVLAWSSEDQRRVALTGLHTQLAERLPIVLEETVRELTSAWSEDSTKEPGIAQPVPFLVVRTQPMSGPAGLFIGVRIDRFRPPNSLTDAATRFHISPREVQVLALLLDGNHLDQIANRLHITSSTVQDHIKSMLDKTESRNRSELIARVLGWESTPSARQA
jgi:DNA-binding CsgD family transcriptional regulator